MSPPTLLVDILSRLILSVQLTGNCLAGMANLSLCDCLLSQLSGRRILRVRTLVVDSSLALEQQPRRDIGRSVRTNQKRKDAARERTIAINFERKGENSDSLLCANARTISLCEPAHLETNSKCQREIQKPHKKRISVSPSSFHVLSSNSPRDYFAKIRESRSTFSISIQVLRPRSCRFHSSSSL